MARAVSTDYMHSMRFHVKSIKGDAFGAAEGGFATCSMPELTVEVSEYADGLMTYKRKFPGRPTVNDVTIGRGLVNKNSALYQWILAAVEGKEYRQDIQIAHYSREEQAIKLLSSPSSDGGALPTTAPTVASSRTIVLYNAFPMRVKIGSDLDANGNEVAIEEIDISYESFDLLNGGVAVVSKAQTV